MSNRKRPPSAGGDVDAQRLTSGVDDDALGGRAAGGTLSTTLTPSCPEHPSSLAPDGISNPWA